MRSPRLRAVLLLFGLAVLGLATFTTARSIAPFSSRVSDIDTYHAMIRNIRAGVPYYDAIGGELRRWGYATREVFNWRTPLLMRAQAMVPDAAAHKALLGLTLLLCAAMLIPPVTRWDLISLFMQVGMATMFGGTDLYVMGEPWAGVLIALSICAYRVRRAGLGVAFGLLALFVRELAAPYCVLCTLRAAFARRWREAGAWAIGACAYFVYYGWHLTRIFAHRLPTDIAHPRSWLGLGGIESVVTKVHWQGWLILLPMWATALAVLVIVSGVLNRRADGLARAASLTYLGFFLLAGQGFDWYWGLVAWPTWALVFGRGVQEMVDSVRALTATRPARPKPA